MSRRFRVRTVLLAIAVVLTACAQEFDRDDALASLRAAGADDVTATCVADTLLVLGELDAADARAQSTATGRSAIVQARERCTSFAVSAAPADVAGVAVERPSTPSVAASAAQSGTVVTGNAEPAGGGPVTQEAVQRLTALGRTEEFATCVVERLRSAAADYVFENPTFGLGATPEEASAFAICS